MEDTLKKLEKTRPTDAFLSEVVTPEEIAKVRCSFLVNDICVCPPCLASQLSGKHACDFGDSPRFPYNLRCMVGPQIVNTGGGALDGHPSDTAAADGAREAAAVAGGAAQARGRPGGGLGFYVFIPGVCSAGHKLAAVLN